MEEKYVLGIDPGSAKLGMSCVRWNGDNCKDEKNYAVEWMCLIHLTDSFKGKETKIHNPEVSTTSEIVKYKEMHCQIERLHAFLDGNESFNAVLKLPGLRACIEQQEGVRDINVLFALMRINFLSGFICCYLKRKGVPFTFVPKTYKCGWSYMGVLAKKKSETPSPTKGITKKRTGGSLSPARKKALVKKYKKEAVCALVREVIRMGPSPEIVKRTIGRHKDADFNHMADSASQAMRYIKEMELSGCYANQREKTSNVSPLKEVKDCISNDMKTRLSNIF